MLAVTVRTHPPRLGSGVRQRTTTRQAHAAGASKRLEIPDGSLHSSCHDSVVGVLTLVGGKGTPLARTELRRAPGLPDAVLRVIHGVDSLLWVAAGYWGGRFGGRLISAEHTVGEEPNTAHVAKTFDEAGVVFRLPLR